MKHRPLIGVSEKDKKGPKLWWYYAVDSILEDIREKRKRKSWTYLLERRQDRKLYVDLFKRTKKAKWVNYYLIDLHVFLNFFYS